MPARIDVVIVAYNRYELTQSCLRHLAAQTLDHRLIVVDNGSTDGTMARLQSEWPAVHVERLEQNRGFAEACNRGIAAARGEVFVLLNNDVDCRPGFLEALLEPLNRNARIGSVAALMLQPGEQLIDSAGLTADAVLSGFPRLQGRPIADAQSRQPTLTGPAGTAAAYRRAAWEEVGGLDETIFAYMEDFDLALRLRSAGWETALAADAVGVHLGSATHRHRSAWQREHGGFSRGYMMRRYGLLRDRAALRTLATEALVIVGDALISRDLAALRGRLAGWRAGRGHRRLAMPPREAIDCRIGFRDSLQMRRGVYGRRAV